MKAFEKWNKGIERKNGEWCSWQEREDAWKAALEWILSKGGASYWVNEISDVIKEELKDE